MIARSQNITQEEDQRSQEEGGRAFQVGHRGSQEDGSQEEEVLASPEARMT